jgi:uncharacterized LabA/DUF88 family protein
MTRTFVYIDGFNFYYGCYRDRARPQWAKYKWLDWEKFCDALFPKDNVLQIKYYTAMVDNRPPDNHQNDRQKIYLAAMSQQSRVKISYGRFLSQVTWMPCCNANGKCWGKTVRVLKTEEKGTDVNLAVDLLHDGSKDAYDYAMVISNDSDLVAAIKIVRSEYGKKIGLVNPHPSRPSVQLTAHADLHFKITEKLMIQSQLPDAIQVGGNIIHRPLDWR